MNQLESEYRVKGSSGRSRAKGTSRKSSSNRRSSSTIYRSGNASSARRSSGHRGKKKGPDTTKIVAAIVLVVILVALAAWGLKQGTKGKGVKDESVSASEPQTTIEIELTQPVSVEGVDITGMSENEAKAAILAQYPWSMKVSYKEESFDVEDLLTEKVDGVLKEVYSGTGTPQESYSLDLADGLQEAADAQAKRAADKWNKAAKNGSIDSYDAQSGEFVFVGEENGFAIDETALSAAIQSAVKEKQFDATIEATGNVVAPDVTAATAKQKYKTLSSFTTTTTSNQNRNTNIKLAAQALNGTIVKPGHEFSFNGTVGQRTEKKGYKGAAAYNNGEVVQEIGGGVCQVSTTLYNAVMRAGLTISSRRSHTFEPSYVTPGMDATVSWDQPDFKFVNNSKTAIGIRASYSNQKVTISVYGIPILEDGVKWDLRSEKVETIDPPAPTYIEDQTLQPGTEKVKSKGTQGSRWVTYKVVTKDGKTVSEEVDHKVTYKGHAPVILRNTSGVTLKPNETTTSAETTQAAVDGMPDGYTPTTAPATTAASATTQAATTAPAKEGENAGPGASATQAASETTPATVAPALETTAAPAETVPVIAPNPQ